MNFKKIICLILSLSLCFLLVACGSSQTDTATDGKDLSELTKNKVNVVITVKNFGDIELELYSDLAPITVKNFISLAKSGFYDGITFHRIIKDFMIQGGDPEGTGMGGSKEKIKGEFTANGHQNDLSHTRGVISMARLGNDMNSASSQFFIVHKDSPHLDGQYASFGMVTKGLDVVDKIAEETPSEAYTGSVEKANQPVIETIKVLD